MNLSAVDPCGNSTSSSQATARMSMNGTRQKRRMTRRWLMIGGAAVFLAPKGMRMTALAGGPEIIANRPDALMDVEISIELRGFPPRQPVTIAATQLYP